MGIDFCIVSLYSIQAKFKKKGQNRYMWDFLRSRVVWHDGSTWLRQGG